MRRLLIALAISLLPSFAIAHGHGSGGHGSGGHMGGSKGASVGASMGAARAGAPVASQMGARVATNMGGPTGSWGKSGIRHGHHHRHARFFFAGGPWFGGYGYYGYDCWRWTPTPWGPRRVWVCDYY
jgi:hypothetical protein